jgi:hypothetical protein
MIDKRPGDWSDWMISSYGPTQSINTTVEESVDVRASAVLQSDGTPYMLQRRKHSIGFKLNKRSN